jgi:DNA-binding CsgD family transcriptional regulator
MRLSIFFYLKYSLKESLDSLYLIREKDCLYWCIQGKTSDEISTILGISKRTVENNIKNIKEKLNCDKQVQLAVTAMKAGIFSE